MHQWPRLRASRALRVGRAGRVAGDPVGGLGAGLAGLLVLAGALDHEDLADAREVEKAVQLRARPDCPLLDASVRQRGLLLEVGLTLRRLFEEQRHIVPHGLLVPFHDEHEVRAPVEQVAGELALG